MKTIVFFAVFLLFGCRVSPAGEEVSTDKLDAKIAAECKAGGGCYAVPKAAIEKMRSLFIELQTQIEQKDEEIKDLRKKLPHSCA